MDLSELNNKNGCSLIFICGVFGFVSKYSVVCIGKDAAQSFVPQVCEISIFQE